MVSPMKLWIIADTHFYHENIKLYQGRPDDFNEQIIRNWNKLVAYDDVVIHLGDVIFGLDKDKRLPSLMASLPGKKILCRGNHDPKPAEWYMERGFDFACDYFVYQDIAFSHAPLTPLPPQTLVSDGRSVAWNVHGHFHKGGDVHEADREKRPSATTVFADRYYNSAYYNEHRDKYVLVQIEDGLAPIPLEDVLTLEKADPS
jgi:calcineurin-like phosphoesterase family protein